MIPRNSRLIVRRLPVLERGSGLLSRIARADAGIRVRPGTFGSKNDDKFKVYVREGVEEFVPDGEGEDEDEVVDVIEVADVDEVVDVDVDEVVADVAPPAPAPPADATSSSSLLASAIADSTGLYLPSSRNKSGASSSSTTNNNKMYTAPATGHTFAAGPSASSKFTQATYASSASVDNDSRNKKNPLLFVPKSVVARGDDGKELPVEKKVRII